MQRTGSANLPLHPGHAPRWLFGRMVKLAKAITTVMVEDKGTTFFLQRISDPFWFQALSCVLGFDWHSSGTTTVTGGALKEALKDMSLGLAVAGGKGKASLATPKEIVSGADKLGLHSNKVDFLVYSSRLSAKVDNAAVQDGYSLYHHLFLFDEHGNWVVVQQGLNSQNNYARRYHWASEGLDSFVETPHKAILSVNRSDNVLNLTSSKNKDVRSASVDLVKDSIDSLQRSIRVSPVYQKSLADWVGLDKPVLTLPRHINWDALRKAYEIQPQNYEELLGVKGVGPATVRALAYISALLYGTELDWKDPVKYSFAVGGKDGVPYPVNRKAMDQATELIIQGIESAKVGDKAKLDAIKRLKALVP